MMRNEKDEFNPIDHEQEVVVVSRKLNEWINSECLSGEYQIASVVDALTLSAAALAVVATSKIQPIADREQAALNLKHTMSQVLGKYCMELLEKEEI
jgi:transcription elongation factor